MIAQLVCMAALTLNPHISPLVDSCDCIEINHVYDMHGRLVLSQIIALDWNHDAERYDVRAWRLLKQPDRMYPIRSNHGYTSIWHDGENLRVLHARTRLETWLQYDPEIKAREVLPQSRRKGLLDRAPKARHYSAVPVNHY